MKWARTGVRRDVFRRLDLQPERIAIERQGIAQVCHGDAYVIQRYFHIHQLARPSGRAGSNQQRGSFQHARPEGRAYERSAA
jgi:hypothetical protein